jgi:autotransporter-associated beta strand protein
MVDRRALVRVIAVAAGLLGVGYSASAAVWNGGAGTWAVDTGGWDIGRWVDGNSAQFGKGTDTAGTVTVTGTVKPISITFNAPASGTYTISGGTIDFNNTTATVTTNANAYVGSTLTNGGLTKAGAGFLWLSGNNTFDGDVDLQTSLLLVQHNNALGSTSGKTTVQNGATLDLQTTSNLTIGEPLVLNGITGAGGRGALRSYGAFSHVWNGTITLGSNAGINVDSAAGTLTVNGLIDDGLGTFSLTKFGPGTLVLTNANTYGGDTIIGQGALKLDSGNNRLPTGTVVKLGGGSSGATSDSGALVLNGRSQTVAGLVTVGGGTSNRVVGGAAALSTLTLDFASGNNVYSGVLGGTGTNENNLALTKMGGGVLSLSGNNTFDGDVDLQAGLLLVQHSNALGSTAGKTTVQNGATLDLQAGANLTIGESLVLNGITGAGGRGALRSYNVHSHVWNGTITLGSNAGINVDSAAGTLTVNGLIDDGPGTFSLTKFGPGTLVLTNANTYGGDTIIGQGALKLDSGNNRLPAGTVIKLGGGADGTTGDSGTLMLNGRSQTVANLLTAGAGTSNRVVGGSATTSELVVNFVGTTSVFGGILGGTGTNENNLALTKTGTGFFYLSGNNTYDGLTQVNGGILIARSATALGSAVGGTRVANGTTLQFELSNATIAEPITLNGIAGNGNRAALRFLGSNVELAGPITLESNSGIKLEGASNTISGVIDDGAGTFGLTVWGHLAADVLTLSGQSTYGGSTYLPLGNLRLSGGNNRLPAATTLVLGGTPLGGAANQSGKLILDGMSQELAGLQTSGSGTDNRVVGGSTTPAELVLDIASGSNTFGGILGGAGTNENNLALTKAGAGTLTLTGSNTYTGNTAISAGTLALSGSSTNNISGSATIDVASNAFLDVTGLNGGTIALNGQTLKGNGTVTGSVTFGDASAISAGSSPGLLAITGNYTQTGGTMLAEIGGDDPGSGYDQIAVGGTATLGGTVGVATLPGFLPAVGATFDILTAIDGISNDDLTGVSFTYSGDMLPATYWVASIVARSDLGTNAEALELAVGVPEPSTILLAGLGLLGVILLGWRRSRGAPVS